MWMSKGYCNNRCVKASLKMNVTATLIHKGIFSNSTDFDSNKNSHCFKCDIYVKLTLRYFAKYNMISIVYIYILYKVHFIIFIKETIWSSYFLDITLKTHNSSQKIAAYWRAISDSLRFTLYTSYIQLSKEYYP